MNDADTSQTAETELDRIHALEHSFQRGGCVVTDRECLRAEVTVSQAARARAMRLVSRAVVAGTALIHYTPACLRSNHDPAACAEKLNVIATAFQQ
jgi:hypothetical protein